MTDTEHETSGSNEEDLKHSIVALFCNMQHKPDERHANRTASALEWYDRHRAYYNIWFKRISCF